MSISPARLAAFRILVSSRLEGGNLADVMQSELGSLISERDRSLTTELVYGVLRRQLQLDWILSQLCKTDLGKFDLPVLLALRLGAYQILFLSRIPIPAAVDESVELVKTARMKSAAGMVNAVLRRLNRQDFQTAQESLEPQSDEGLAILFSHPKWLIARWRKQFGDETTNHLLTVNNSSPGTFFRMNSRLDEKEVIQEIVREGITAEPHPIVDGCWKVNQGDLRKTQSFLNGQIYVQDPASQLIPCLLEAVPGNSCLDVCAAPGGKLSQLARLSHGESLLVGMDLRWQRLRLAAQLHLRHWPALALVVADGKAGLPFSIKFDRILVDAPCSGTGTLQRNPDIRWRLFPSDFQRQHATQAAILNNAAQYLKPGGTIVYSTCSLEEEENESVVMEYLECHPDFELAMPHDSRLHGLFDKRHFFQMLPSQWNSDGFFAAVLRRKTLTG